MTITTPHECLTATAFAISIQRGDVAADAFAAATTIADRDVYLRRCRSAATDLGLDIDADRRAGRIDQMTWVSRSRRVAAVIAYVDGAFAV